MGIYSSFDIGQMLNVMNRHADEVRLTSEITGGDCDWTLYVFDEKHGEFEQTGTLFQVVVSAFKPYLEIAKQERNELSNILGGGLGSTETVVLNDSEVPERFLLIGYIAKDGRKELSSLHGWKLTGEQPIPSFSMMRASCLEWANQDGGTFDYFSIQWMKFVENEADYNSLLELND